MYINTLAHVCHLADDQVMLNNNYDDKNHSNKVNTDRILRLIGRRAHTHRAKLLSFLFSRKANEDILTKINAKNVKRMTKLPLETHFQC